jgi:hypothetical protein
VWANLYDHQILGNYILFFLDWPAPISVSAWRSNCSCHLNFKLKLVRVAISSLSNIQHIPAVG